MKVNWSDSLYCIGKRWWSQRINTWEISVYRLQVIMVKSKIGYIQYIRKVVAINYWLLVSSLLHGSKIFTIIASYFLSVPSGDCWDSIVKWSTLFSAPFWTFHSSMFRYIMFSLGTEFLNNKSSHGAGYYYRPLQHWLSLYD